MAVIGSLVSAIAALLLAIPGTDPRAVPDKPGSDSLRTRHFVFQYAPQQEKVAQRLSRRAEAIRARHCKLIEPCFDGAITVQIAQTEDGFLDLQPYRAHIDWAAGVAYAELQLIILRVDKDMLLSLDETFEHEVSHVLLLQATKERPPRWFIEGMAIIQADQDLIERFERVSAATLSDSTLRLDEIAESFPASTEGRALAYAQSGLFVAHLRNRFGDRALQELVLALAHGLPFHKAFREVFDVPLADVEKDWTRSLGSLGWLRALTDDWLLWTLMAGLLLVAVAVRLRRTRRRRETMGGDDVDWEYRSRLH